ncbi:hypothetical protein [Chengkuizengella marina]|uniref:Tetratricopeptide repeat-containing protein n=1 Tax=Chengkuizengella marina TaxID=2507566 RepID=A0A6N9Q7Y4_9BACL|nr:hypothetical protein [Chengkuizengella marina]NBI30860.1 hypothetical protein [Chengkuizengella marina]
MTKQILISIIIGILMGLVGGIFEIQLWIILSITVIIMISITILPNMITIYLTKDMAKVEKFLKKSKNPIYYFYYALLHGLETEAKEAILKIEKKYKNPKWTSLYTILYAHYKRDFTTIENQLSNIKHESIKKYYESLLEIEHNHLEKAQEMVKELSKPWMKEVVLCELSRKRGDSIEAVNHIDNAIESTRGLQRFSIIKYKEQNFKIKK